MPFALHVAGVLLLVIAAATWLRPRQPRLPSGPKTATGLAFGLEVWAAVLAAGEPMADALGHAIPCCEPADARSLVEVLDGLRAGLTATEAWVAALAGTNSPVLTLAGQAWVRSERDGTPLAPVLRRLAADERATAASRGLVAARRAGVLAVVPLGLCTLPAYVLLSVAPAVIGLIRHVR